MKVQIIYEQSKEKLDLNEIHPSAPILPQGQPGFDFTPDPQAQPQFVPPFQFQQQPSINQSLPPKMGVGMTFIPNPNQPGLDFNARITPKKMKILVQKKNSLHLQELNMQFDLFRADHI